MNPPMMPFSILPGITWVLALGAVVYGSFVDDILNALEKAVDCPTCHGILTVLEPLALLGDSAFSNTLIAVCKATKIQADDVCEGIINEQGPIVAHDLRSAGPFGTSATRLCNSLIGLCQQPPVAPYSVKFAKPPPAAPKVWSSRGNAPFQVVHFSDVHIDRSYVADSEANCTKPICCRKYADQSGPIKIPAGAMGSHGCDAPPSLAHSMLQAVKGENTKFSIFTGDVVEAAVWLVNKQEITSDLQTLNIELATLLNSPVYPAIGNHEVAPINSFPRNTSTGVLSSQWVFDIESPGWAPWIGATAASSVQHMSGSYATVVPGTNLKIISLNTIYWYRNNFYLFDRNALPPDPNGILNFAAQQLQAAEDAGQRAWIIAHMAPGSVDAIFDQSNYFDQIVRRYNNTIAAQFYGHSHLDEFEIAYSDYGNQNAYTATSVAYLAPSLTPRTANPAFRVYDVDPDTYEIMDSRTFIANMDDSSFQTSPTWEVEYSARDVYAPALGGWPSGQSLSPEFWHKVTDAFTSNDSVFQQYIAFKTRGTNVVPCTGDCKTSTVCGLRALRAENGCHIAMLGTNFRREVEVVSSPQADHCEAIGLPEIFSMMVDKVRTFGAK